jgi:hypothetical protein
VHDIVEWVLLEVALRHFPCELHQALQVDVRELKQVVELENLVHKELQTRLIQNLVEVEGIKRSHVDSIQCHLQMLSFHVHQINHD